MTRKTTNISILHVSETLISRLRVRRTSRGVDVIGFDQEQGEWRDAALESALAAFAEKHHLGEDHVFTVLPRHEITARILEFPSQEPDELASMVRLSAEEFVPFPTEELIIDQCVVQRMASGSSKVLAAFAHQDLVNAHIALLRGAKIDPEQVFLSTACLASACLAASGAGGVRYALVHLAPGGLDVIGVNGTDLEYGRAVGSSQDWSLAGPAVDDMLEELRVEISASLSAYRRESEDGEGAERVYLSSETVDVSGHAEALTQQLGIDCEPASFARGLIVGGQDKLGGLPLASLGAALLAQGRGAVTIRLLPQTLLSARERTSAKRTALWAGGVVAAAVIAVGALYFQMLHVRQVYIDELQAEVARMRPRAEGIAEKQKQLQILEQAVDREGGVLDLLSSLSDVFPESGMNITRFVFTNKQEIDLYGRAESLKEIETFAQDLIDLGKTTIPLFANAQRAYENQADEQSRPIQEYRILIPFPKEEKDDASE